MKDNNYIDSNGITHNRELLSDVLEKKLNNGLSYNINATDANTITKSGFYYGNEVTNTPVKYCYLLVITHHSSYNYCVQICFQQNEASPNFWVRQKSGADNWGRWCAFTGTFI